MQAYKKKKMKKKKFITNWTERTSSSSSLNKSCSIKVAKGKKLHLQNTTFHRQKLIAFWSLLLLEKQKKIKSPFATVFAAALPYQHWRLKKKKKKEFDHLVGREKERGWKKLMRWKLVRLLRSWTTTAAAAAESREQVDIVCIKITSSKRRKWKRGRRKCPLEHHNLLPVWGLM